MQIKEPTFRIGKMYKMVCPTCHEEWNEPDKEDNECPRCGDDAEIVNEWKIKKFN